MRENGGRMRLWEFGKAFWGLLDWYGMGRQVVYMHEPKEREIG